jgi:CRP-like cAMP-binding protein
MPLFRYVKDDVLLGVAAILEEQLVQPGEVIIQKGEMGTIMYMVVTGRVRVHDENQHLKEIGEHDVFGELAALSPQERIASVTALQETLLLKISNRMIYDLMELQTELAKGVIQVLCQRIRTIASDLTQALTL